MVCGRARVILKGEEIERGMSQKEGCFSPTSNINGTSHIVPGRLGLSQLSCVYVVGQNEIQVKMILT